MWVFGGNINQFDDLGGEKLQLVWVSGVFVGVDDRGCRKEKSTAGKVKPQGKCKYTEEVLTENF